ncbi:MAG: oligosaccharide flippase family protein [Candidatus Neomarinimicrobiota bacterium]|jgi:O-antigen/teichoic acid export membrane protein|nr:oligosaccharide flippase family protein [Candidatus Neomarinimicrobiota bacterium]MDD3966460.1 oligosaccharide flippase family protein [Candidatus Neomarinimicrobiota bacterium]MDX9779490.1 oligosaccharide flippase family protein [bacterium]
MIRQDIIRLSKQTLVYGLGYVAARMINFLLLPFYTHHIAPAEYGVISLVYAFIAFMNIIYHYGLESAFLRFYSKAGTDEGHEQKDVFSTVLISLLLSSLFFSLLIILFAPGLSRMLLQAPQYTRILRLSAAILFMDALFLIPLHYLRISNKAVIFTLITLANVLINVGLNIYLIRYRGKGIEAVFISNLAASSFNVLLLIPVLIKNWNARFLPGLWKKMLLFGLPFIPGGLASMIIELSDRYMLQAFRGLEEVGLYSAGHKLGIFMMLIVMAFRFAWQPFFLQKHNDPEAPRLFSRILTFFVFIMSLVFLLVSFYIREIVSLPLMGKTLIESSYWGGIAVVPYILAAYVFDGIYLNFHPAIYYSKKTWVISLVVGIAALINVTLNLILIPSLGMIAAGISSLSAYVFMAGCTYLIVRKWLPVRYEGLKLLLIFVLTLAACLLYFGLDLTSPGLRLLIIGAYALMLLPLLFYRKGVRKHGT